MKLRFSIHYAMLFAMIATAFPYMQRFLRARGFSDSEVGYLQGFMALAGACGSVGIGHLADRFGRRLVLVICVSLYIVLMPVLNATNLLVPAAFLAAGVGLFVRTTIPITDAVVAGGLREPARDYGRVRIWGSIGFIVTLLSIRGLHLIDEKSSTSIMTAMVVTAGLCLVSAAFLPQGHRPSDRPKSARPDGGHFDGVFWLFLLAAGMHALGMSSCYYFFTNYLHDVLKMEEAAWVWAIGPMAEIPMLFCGGWFLRRWGIRRMLIAAMAAVSVRVCIYGLVPHLGAILPAQLLHALTFGLFHAASIEFLRRKVPARRRGLAMAIYVSVGLGLSSWIGSSLGGIIVENWGYAALYLLYAIPPLVGIVCVVLAGRKFDLPA